MRSTSVWVKAALVCLLLAGGLLGQQVTATLTGVVRDPSGAVIPAATVTVQSTETGQVRTLTTDSSGTYTASLLPPGIYIVTGSARGFQKATVPNVILHVGDLRSLNLELQPGAVTQTITVTTTTTPVQASTGAQSQTITGNQVRQLQLNNRNFEQLVTLQPGVSSQLPDQVGFGLQNTTAVSVNGSRTSANNWTVDGSDINDSGSNATLLNVPSIDAMQEFTIARSSYDAQYGRSSGGQVAVVTKSGTNQFHGSAYEFFRNDKLNANNYLLNAANQPRAAFRYNDFGYTFGGPIIKDKTFFFWSQEWRKTRTPSNFFATLPTAQELTGNFNGIATLNPADAPAGCVVGNTIQQRCFSQNATAYINNVYSQFTPNAPNNTFISSASAQNDFRQEIGRLDQKFGDKLQVFGRYMGDSVPTTEPGGLFAGEPLPGISNSSTDAPGRNVVAHMTWTISPTVLNEAAFNYSWGAINSNITGIVGNATGFTGLTVAQLPFTDPYNRIPGVSFGGIVTGVVLPNAPYHERNIDKTVYDNTSVVAGNNSIRFGFTISWMRKSENGPLPTNGNFTFRDTGSAAAGAYMPAFANFLLGQASQFTQASRDIIPDLHYLNAEAYIQDDWKARANLTFNLGLRYSIFATPHDVNNILSNFDPYQFDPAAAPTIDPVTGEFILTPGGPTPATYTNGIIIGGVRSPFGARVNPNSYKNFAPRLGFSWDPTGDGKTAVRGGYGIFFDRSLNGIWEQNQFANPPFVQSVLIANPSNANIFDNPSSGSLVTGLNPINLHATGSPGWPVAYEQDWNFSIQREVMPNTRLEVAYVGSAGTHLIGIIDRNQVPLAVREANPGVDANALRPYPGYQAISTIDNSFSSNYNSLQVSLNRQVAAGLSLGAAYTWSRALTDNPTDRSTPPQDTYNLRGEYGPASFNRGQIFVVNYVYDLPFWLNRKDMMGTLFGGWEVSGITIAESGLPLTPSQTSDPFNSSDFNPGQCPAPTCGPGGIGIDPSPVAPRPNQVANPNGGPQTAQEWFNTAAFVPVIGAFGTAGRGVITGPGWFNWDIAAMKNFKFEHFNTQIRGEFFNAFNHTSFNGVGTNVNSSSYGLVTSTHDPRIVQLAIKFTF